jgi:formylglycine-generating enzyme required for sulfatase activity
MSRIFISYRRADSIAITGRIYDRLLAHFGDGNVFQDVDDIPFGVDFRTHLQNEIDRCDVVLVIIGQQWQRIADEHGRRRLDNPADFVRIEVENGLRLGKLVIPVLVDGAAMPQEAELTESLRDLCYRNAALIRHNPDFNRDIARLIDGIVRYLEGHQSRSETSKPIQSQPPPVEVIGEPPAQTSKTDVPQQPIHKISPRPPGERPTEVPVGGSEVRALPNILAILPPPFEWCEIPAGKVTLEDASKYDPPGTKGGTYDVPAFAIAKYPITNVQYQVFVEAKDGYRDPKWWDYSEHARKWRAENSKLKDTGFEGDDLPRTNVSWYDSLAFCRWLTAKTLTLNPSISVPAQRISLPSPTGRGAGGEGLIITLPTEQQWQRAAQGDDGRQYPWGNDFDKSRCNTRESGIKQPTPVTTYPNGASPYGVIDMSGNIWEWCLTEWGQDSIDLTNSQRRVVRGGSWYYNLVLARAASRIRLDPRARNDDQGFRLCAAPIS